MGFEQTAQVSVIIPVYNVAKYLRQCLDSVINQTLNDIEIICIDDGSTDNSPAILEKYASKDNRIKVIHQENQGQGVARNRGVELAQGEYIQFVDPDDWLEPNTLETLYNFAQEHNSQVVKFNFYDYNDYSGKLKKFDFIKSVKEKFDYDLSQNPYYTWKDLKPGCLTKLDLHVWAYFYLTSFIKSNEIHFAPTKHGEDHLFSNGAFLLAKQIDYLNKYLYYYRNRSGSAVNIKSDNNFCVFDNIKLFKDFLIQHSLYEELKDEMKDYAQQVLSWHYDLIPETSIKKYEDLCRGFFESQKEFEDFIKEKQIKRSFLENIFSIKNERKEAIKYKAVTILGITFLIKPKRHKTRI